MVYPSLSKKFPVNAGNWHHFIERLLRNLRFSAFLDTLFRRRKPEITPPTGLDIAIIRQRPVGRLPFRRRRQVTANEIQRVVDLRRMKTLLPMASLVTAAALVAAQSPVGSPATAPGSQMHASQLGFSYSVPRDWEVVDSQASLPVAKEQAGQKATSDEERKGLACVAIELTARHGEPASVVVEVALPFDCFGQEMTEKDLPGFATGASEGLKQSFDITEPVFGTYSLGSHNLWIERAKGNPKGHPELPYTIEITCSLLKKAAVCWMAMAADDAALRTFERGAVKLDGDSAGALVPPTAFDKKPS
jgi:hypothetical protein